MSHTQLLFTENNILNVFQLNLFQITAFMYRLDNGLLPPTFLNYMVRSSDIHDYFLRHKDRFRSEQAQTTLKLLSLKCLGPCVYSKIPCHVKSSSSLSKFETSYKFHLLHNHT